MWVVLHILLCLFIWRGLLSCNKHVMWSGSEGSDPLPVSHGCLVK